VTFSLLDFMIKSLWLAFASPSRFAAAIGLCLTLMVGRVFHMFWLSVENHNHP
jgi:hypothetical protein